MKRLFWATLGIGFGAAVAIGAMRWANKTREALKPTSVADRAVEAAGEWRERLLDALEAGREAMAERERELRSTYGVDREAT